MKAKHWTIYEADFKFFKIYYYSKTKTFYFWFGLIEGRSECSNGWMLFGLSINDYAGIHQVYTKFILTLFNHNFNFGKVPTKGVV